MCVCVLQVCTLCMHVLTSWVAIKHRQAAIAIVTHYCQIQIAIAVKITSYRTAVSDTSDSGACLKISIEHLHCSVNITRCLSVCAHICVRACELRK